MDRPNPLPSYIAFTRDECLARGTLADVALATRRALDQDVPATVVVLDAATSQVVDLDLRGSDDDVRTRYRAAETASHSDGSGTDARPPSPGPGRPRLGVVSREVSLLPRHWAWLGQQRGGASATLRRLVDEARQQSAPQDQLRAAQESVDRFMRTVAGDRPNYEEASRAFYSGRDTDLAQLTAEWPLDIRSHLDALVRRCREVAP